MRPIEAIRSPTAVLITSLLLIAGISALDVWTGRDFRLYPLYFVPLVLAATHLPVPQVRVVTATALAAWLGAKLLDGTEFPSPLVWVANFSIQGAGLYYVAAMVVRLQALRDVETRTARQDALTGLHNPLGFREAAERLLDLARRYPAPLVFAYLDLDHFKRVNDEQGHQRGDEVLRLAAHTMRSSLRNTDLLARQGGDEFVVLMPQVSAADAEHTLDRLRQTLQRNMEAAGCPVTLSVGAVAYAGPPPALDDLFRVADALMYDIKKTGRNGVRVVPA